MKRNTVLWLALVMLQSGSWLAYSNPAHSQIKVVASQSGIGKAALETDEGLIVYDEGRSPGDNYIRVNFSLLGGDYSTPSFWRVKVRNGFVWADGYWEDDRYIPGYWRPERSKGENWQWVPGHWIGRKWIQGRWRVANRTGYEWIEGHWTRHGEWVEGYWTPIAQPPKDKIWEPGYWGHRGEWVEGQWRPISKRGYIWVPGEYNDRGNWVRGRWVRAKADEVWVRGYWDHSGRWYPGKVTRIPKPSQKYIHGHYNRRGEWLEPRWMDEADWSREQERQLENYRNDREQDSAYEEGISQEEQLQNYREDREGPSNPEPVGGQVRKIGGGDRGYQERHQPPVKPYAPPRPNPHQQSDRGYEPEQDRGQHGYSRDHEPEYKQSDRGYSREREPEPEYERSDKGQHRGWEQGKGNPHANVPITKSEGKAKAEPPQPSVNPGQHQGWEKNKQVQEKPTPVPAVVEDGKNKGQSKKDEDKEKQQENYRKMR